MSKFAHCHPSGNLMWCQHYNGSWIAFPISNDSYVKPQEGEERGEVDGNEETTTTSEK